MRAILFLLLPIIGFAQPTFRAEFNFLVSETPVEGGEYRIKGLFSDGDALGFGVDSVKAGYFFYDSKGFLYEIVYSNGLQPLTIEVDKVNHSAAPTTGTGIITNVTVNIDLPFETSKLSGKLRSVIEVDTRLKLDSSYLVDLGRLTDVDTTGKTDGSIILYDGTSGNWEAQANSIDNLTDGYKFNGNIVLGRPFVRKPTSVDYANIYLGVNAGPDSLLGYANIAIGQDVFRSFTADPVSQGNANIAIGAQAMNKTLTGFQNVAIGRNAFKGNLTGSDNVAIGRGAGYNNFGDPDNILTNYNQSIFIGTHAAGLDTFSTNEIAIGYNAVGNGSNTATLGNNNITATYLKGTTNLRGYGAGNKEAADLGKTGSGYFLEVATDGTLVESVSAGGGVSNLGALTDVDTTGKTDGSIILYDAVSGNWEAQANSIENLVDGRSYDTFLLLGVTNTSNNTGQFNTIVSKNSYNEFVDLTGEGNSIFGYNAGANLKTGNRNTLSGRSAGVNLIQGEKNTISGALAGHGNVNGSQNVLSGYLVNSLDTIGANNVIMGAYANSQVSFLGNEDILPINYGKSNSDSVVIIGAFAKTLNPISTNEIVLGAFTTGNGSNTATLGNNNITATYLKGTTNLRGYGAGNKEAADLGKTASAYIAGYATDGTLIELPSSGLGISLTDLSVTQNSPGTAGLTYNNTNGVFTYTPPDLSSYLTTEVDGSVTNEIQDLSLTGNTLSLSGDATTVDLSTYLDDQTVVLTQGGIVSISGTYPNFTISATEVDGSVTNEIQDLSLTGNTLSLSNDATTVDLSTYLDDQTVTLTGGGITAISGTYPNFTITSTEVDGSVTNEIQDLSLTGNVLSLSGDATTVDLTESVQDEINNTITAGEGISVVYDDGAGTLTISAPSGAGNTDEQTLSINDATAELSISNGNTVDLSEAIDNQVNNLFVDGTNILSTYDDISNSLTVRTTDALTQIDAIAFDNNVTDAVTSRLQYNADVGTFVAGMANNVPIKIGQDIGWYVKNNTASTIPKGTAVMAVGADGNSGIMLIDEMVFDGSADAKYFLGVTAEAITSGSNGFVISQGVLKGFDTSLISPGSVLYGDPTTPGGFVTTEPTGTNLKLPIANTLSQTNNGTIAIRVHTGLYMKDIHDVDVTGVTNNSILKYNSTGGYWDIATDLVDDADADPTNEIQDLSLSGNTLSLSGDATTVDLSSYLDEATTASNGLTLSGTDVKLGGNLTALTLVDLNSQNLYLVDDGATGVGLSILPASNEVAATGNLSASGDLLLTSYGAGSNTGISSGYLAGFTSDGTMIEIAESTFLTSDLTTASNGLTKTGNDIALGGTLSDSKVITLDANSFQLTSSNLDAGYFIDNVNNGFRVYGQTLLMDYGDGTNTGTLSKVLGVTSTGLIIERDPSEFTGIGLTDLSVTTNPVGTAALSYNNTNGVFTYTPPDLSSYLTTEVDGSISNEGLLSASTLISGTTAALTSNTNGGSTVNFTASTGLAVGSSGGNTITFTNTLPEATTASNGLTETGNNITLGGTLNQATTIFTNNNDFIITNTTPDPDVKFQLLSNRIQLDGWTVQRNGFMQFADFGIGNKEPADQSKDFSGYYAGFATDGTLVEINALPITTGTSATIDWDNMPQRIHVLDFGANTSLTLSFSNVLVGGIYTLRVTGNAGTDTLIWPAAAKFEDGTSVGTVTLQDGGQMFTFYWDGTNYWVK